MWALIGCGEPTDDPPVSVVPSPIKRDSKVFGFNEDP
jgi:hypothetical protein